MNPAKYRHRITIQHKVSGTGDDGFPTEQWEDLFPCWAEKLGLRGREYFEAAAVQAERTTKWRIRYRDGITTAMRLKYKEQTHDIKSVVDTTGRKVELELLTEEVSPGG